MKFIRFLHNNAIHYGLLEKDNEVHVITGTPLQTIEKTGKILNIDDLKLLAPLQPQKALAIGLNYSSHLGDKPPPKVPEPFTKLTSSIIGPKESIIIPQEATDEKVILQPEMELAFVMAKTAKRVKANDAYDYILGYTCANDFSARDWQMNDLQWVRGKCCDTFMPIGPYINTDIDPEYIALNCIVNGQVKEEGNTSEMLYSIPEIIEYITRFITLEPGDIVLTGTPGRPPTVQVGDTVMIKLSGLGELENTLVAEA